MPDRGTRLLSVAGRAARVAGIAWAALLILATPPALFMEARRLASAADRLAVHMAPGANQTAASAVGSDPGIQEARVQLRARAGMMTMVALALVAFFVAAVLAFVWDYWGLRGTARRRRNTELMRE
jgi:hypothetical protein